MNKRCAVFLAGALTAAALCCIGCTDLGDRPQHKPGDRYSFEGVSFRIETVAADLTVPWALAWLPDGRMLITERPGVVRVQARPGQTEVLARIDEVDQSGEGGLMGVAVSPDFSRDGWIYLAYTARDGRRQLKNMVVRYRLDAGRLVERTVLLDNLPARTYHNGLPLAFGPDGKLYASTGDAGKGQLAQEMESLAGKFVRLNADGTVPADNPFPAQAGQERFGINSRQSAIWTLGHRNCQGLDWNSRGQMFATEHGPSGIDGGSGLDEVNLIERGGNYGWPLHRGGDKAEDFVAPIKYWGEPAIAPSGATFYRGETKKWKDWFFFCTLRGQSLFAMRFDPDQPQKVLRVERLLEDQFGRLRAAAMGPDGHLYLTTSNRDGRGRPGPNDDRVLRLVPME
ncbi:MAG: PQQ-dependent sugar dehydrogenase [Planctomycetaceae bacterium]|nr:PQQ-dependent sugar dehydrogenase [Planctomycetaceae bacterium]